MFDFQAKYLEDEFNMSEEENLEFQSSNNRSLNRLANAKLDKMLNKDIESSLNENLEKLMNPDRPWMVVDWWYNAVAYDDWTSKMEDRLIKHLKNKAFFQKIEDNPLNGGHDILTFLLINPKVMKSSKIKPLLRMTVSKEFMIPMIFPSISSSSWTVLWPSMGRVLSSTCLVFTRRVFLRM
eukprot:TRINITY_DN35440_c0_g1_i1.p1 TRINITY_DN35440_c0_g1~~TRINITY_DN35440_c0_g1_i1.p1  ORF type:complete len:181 (+),score=36.85 TRINITY_DN35440_c0_g1_i1:465-1007(+)